MREYFDISLIGLPSLPEGLLLEQSGSVIRFHSACDHIYQNTQGLMSEEYKPCTNDLPKFRVVDGKYEKIVDADEENDDGEKDDQDCPDVNPASMIPKFEFRGDGNESAHLNLENEILFPKVRNNTFQQFFFN